MTIISMLKLATEVGLGSRLGTRQEGQLVRPLVVRGVRSVTDQEVLVIDLDGMDVVSYSFADETVAIPYQRLVAGEYGDKYIVVKFKDRELCDDLDVALKKHGLAMFAFRGDPSRTTEWHLLGEIKPHILQTLRAIANAGQLSTSQLAKKIGTTLQNCSNRVMELFEMRLIRRERVSTPQGGVSYLNKFIV